MEVEMRRSIIFVIMVLFQTVLLRGVMADVFINEIMASNTAIIQDCDGDYPDWIELYNSDDSPVNLYGYGLSDRENKPFKWIFPDVTIEAGSYLLIFASGKDKVNTTELHTNFKINADGESLVLTDPERNVVDHVSALAIPAEISIGRQPDGSESWMFFTQSTPGSSNSEQAYSDVADSVTMSVSGGFYDNAVTVAITNENPLSTIYYTLDGSEPDKTSIAYTYPVTINATTVLKARTIADGMLPGDICTNTYFIGVEHSFPIISLSSSNISEIYEDIEKTLEKPVNVEFFEPDGTLGFSIVAGLRLYGNISVTFPQKPLVIMARDRYGKGTIDYQVFPDLPITNFSSLVLRNSGNDCKYTMFRDALGHSIAGKLGIDVQAYRPAVVYLNGEYWGIYNIREKQNEEYLAAHHNVDPDNVDMLEFVCAVNHPLVIEGSDEHYSALTEFIGENDINNTENWEYIHQNMDVNNFLKYCVSQIYFANKDNPHQNIKWWRPRTADGRWRWLLFDIDLGFIWEDDDTLEWVTDPTGMADKQNPLWSTFMLRNLLRNHEFKNAFINRFADYFASVFSTESVIGKIDEFQKNLEPEMPMHIDRWKNSDIYGGPIDSFENWYEEIQSLRDFVSIRQDYVCSHIIKKFKLSGTGTVTLNVSPPQAGSIEISTLAVSDFPWQNIYFNEIPIPLSALPNPGYRFVGWSGIQDTDSASTSFVLSGDLSVTALFEPDNEALNKIVINEVNYNSSSSFNPDDWIELYNAYDIPVNLSGWFFKDEDECHYYEFPRNMIIDPKGYIVLCRDEATFHMLFPEVENYIGNLGFGLSGDGEMLSLINSRGVTVDSFVYDNESPWPVASDGSGATLSLKSPDLDNSLPENWCCSLGYGTPGAYNHFSVDVENNTPLAFSLGQNHPNPFNPSTTIDFSIPTASYVKLSVYSVSGQKVATLADGLMNGGKHSAVFDGSSLASGMYFYRLEAGHLVKSGKMMLMK